MRATRKGDVRERFFSRISKDENGCWMWTGAASKLGAAKMKYGVIAGEIDGVRYAPKGRHILAHRVSWILHYGPIPDGAGAHGTVVRHKCDNPLCVNPEHLELGTQADNVADMNSRNRGSTVGLARASGTQHRRAKFTPEQVAEIVARTEMNHVLAAKYGVAKSTIKRLRCGYTYAEETNSEALRQEASQRRGISRPGMNNPCAKLTPDQVRYIRSSNKTTYQIADELGVTQPTIASARRRATYKDVL
mgnify:CR=1 FL=1